MGGLHEDTRKEPHGSVFFVTSRELRRSGAGGSELTQRRWSLAHDRRPGSLRCRCPHDPTRAHDGDNGASGAPTALCAPDNDDTRAWLEGEPRGVRHFTPRSEARPEPLARDLSEPLFFMFIFRPVSACTFPLRALLCLGRSSVLVDRSSLGK